MDVLQRFKRLCLWTVITLIALALIQHHVFPPTAMLIVLALCLINVLRWVYSTRAEARRNIYGRA